MPDFGPASSIFFDMKVIDISVFYAASGQAKMADLTAYEAQIKELVPPEEDAILTGAAPVWLYMRLAHTLHGRVRNLIYESPVTGPVEIFNRKPR
jgi:hypothetical protein